MLSLVLSVVLLVVGAALLTAGAEGFAENVSGASARLGVSVLALALLLAGAEPEEAVTAMLAAGQGHPALAAGDAIGANLVILTLTLGLAALVTRLPVSRRSLEYGVAAAALGAVAWLMLLNGVLGRLEGAVLVLLYVAGVVWVWRRERQPPLIGEMAELDELTGPAAHPRGSAGGGPTRGSGRRSGRQPGRRSCRQSCSRSGRRHRRHRRGDRARPADGASGTAGHGRRRGPRGARRRGARRRPRRGGGGGRGDGAGAGPRR